MRRDAIDAVSKVWVKKKEHASIPSQERVIRIRYMTPERPWIHLLTWVLVRIRKHRLVLLREKEQFHAGGVVVIFQQDVLREIRYVADHLRACHERCECLHVLRRECRERVEHMHEKLSTQMHLRPMPIATRRAGELLRLRASPTDLADAVLAEFLEQHFHVANTGAWHTRLMQQRKDAHRYRAQKERRMYPITQFIRRERRS